MLLTSWVESMRVAFEKSRKATLNPRRRLQLRSVPSSARQKIQRRVAIEQLEDRTLLTSLIINQLTPGLGVTLNNSILDPDADGVSNFDTIIFEDLTINATSGPGVSIDLDGLLFRDSDNPLLPADFKILFDNVSISSSSGIGVDIELSNLLIDTIAVDSSTISGSVGNAFNVDLTDVIFDEFNIVDSTLTGQTGAGVTVALNASTIEETSVRRSSIDGVAFDITNGSLLRHTTMADNSISGATGNDGVSLNLVDSIAEEFRLTNNNAIQGVSINVDDTVDGGAALLTELFIHSNIISGNTEGAGVSLTLNNVDQFVSITDNSITSNSSHGVVFDQTDGDLSGDISGNVIANNVGHGIFFTPSTTNPLPTGNGAPGVPAFAGVPGPTDKIDFAAPRNEVQLITFEGVPTGGDYTIIYVDGNGVEFETSGILATATAAQVKAALVAATPVLGGGETLEIGVDDILVNGNFQDGYEVEFVNAVGGRNVNPLIINTSTLTGADPSVAITIPTAGNQSEIQRLELTGTPTFGSFRLTLTDPNNLLNSETSVFSFSVLDLSLANQAANAMILQDELNAMAALLGYSDDPIEVTADATGFTINFLETGSLRDTDVPQIIVDDTNLRLIVNVVESPQDPGNFNKPANQIITFVSIDESTVIPNTIVETPTGGFFQLTFQGETTGEIAIDTDADPVVAAANTAANIDAALDALPSATFKTGVEGDFVVTGDFVNGFEVSFNVIQHLELNSTFVPHLGTFDLTFLGQTVTLPFDMANPRRAASAAELELELNAIADMEGYGLNAVSVVATPTASPTVTPTGFDIIFLDSGGLADGVTLGSILPGSTAIPEITINDEDLKFDINMSTLAQGNNFSNERQLLRFVKSVSDPSFPFTLNGANITDPPIGGAFRLQFQGFTTGAIVIPTTPAAMITNINNALEALPIAVNADDFTVTGNFTAGFQIQFIGDFARLNVDPLVATVFPLDLNPSTLLGNFDITSVSLITGDVVSAPSGPLEPFSTLVVDPVQSQDGIGDNEVQTISFPDNPKAGTFTLEYNGEITGPLNFDIIAADVQAALQSLLSISVFDTNGVDDVLVTGSIATGGFTVEFVDDLRAIDPSISVPAIPGPVVFGHGPGMEIDIDFSNLVYVLPTVTTVTQGTTLNEVQEFNLIGTPSGTDTFRLSFDDDATETVDIDYDADAREIYLALIGLATINDDDVIVRGDALTGFEVEFVGSLATINVPQIVVNDSGLTDSTMTVKTTSVGGYLRGIRGNSITGNSGAGVEIDLEMYTSFYGDLSGNTISSNNTAGINLVAADATILHSIDFSLSVDGNTMDDNRGVGVAVSMQNTATGDISITNNTITGTRNDSDVSTPYAGDAIYVDLLGTDVHFEAVSQLRDLTIDGNFLGTDAANTGGLGNVANGVGIHIEESTIIDRTQISNNVIANNTGDGVNFHREDDARVGRADVDPIVGEERAVMIYSNTLTGNSDGIDILAQNGSLTTTDFEIKENVLNSNLRDGLSLHAEADASIFADIINNQITFNLQNGIEGTTRTTDQDYFGTDRRDISGTWIQNDISNNVSHGVRISGRIGNRLDGDAFVPRYLFIGLDGVDPVTGLDRGNLIESNGGDGVQIAAHRDRIEGNVKIANNSILSNATGGIELSGESLFSSIDNNLIAFNIGKGVDINSNTQVVFLRNNTITENTSDGLEVLSANSVSHGELNFTQNELIGDAVTSVTAIGNFIDNNGGRGIDLQTEEQAESDFIFGDGTESGANRIVSNALEGVYVVTTASRGQDQDANSTDVLDATGDVLTSSADMVLQLDTNYIQDNGENSSFASTGLILRIGTMASEVRNISGQTPGTAVSVGEESSANAANGRSNVSVTNNEFEGNFGEDFYAESFTSTVDPPTTQDIWIAPTGNPAFRVLASHRRDPLAKLNLVFEGNTGNGLSVTNVGAFYDNAEPDFKSRLNNKVAPNPDGPFNSDTRRRNAQRVASRTNLDPSSGPNAAPTAVGLVADAFVSTPGAPITVVTTDPHGLFSNSTVEITGVESDELGLPSIFSFLEDRLSPANGVFVIDVIDNFSFTLRSTEGAVIGAVTPGTGTWSFNDTGAFLYDGMGVSTFRIAQGFDGVGGSPFGGSGGFQEGDSFLFETNRPGAIFGELDFSWDTWVPTANSFLAPLVSTFLTADISVTVPDPSNVTAVGDFTISFTEDVAGVDINQFSLFKDNVDISSLLMASMLEQNPNSLRNFTLNIDSIIAAQGDGEYELRLNADGFSITDAKYTSGFNTLSFGDVERFTVDTDEPTAEFEEVELVLNTPISGAAGEVVINFNEDVIGVELSDFTLTFDDGSGPVNKDLSAATLTQVTGSQFVLDLSKVTSLSGDYVLTLNTGGSGSITDLAGNAIQVGDDVEWSTDTLAPIAQFENVADQPLSDPLFFVLLKFGEPVSGFDDSSITVEDNHGNVINVLSINPNFDGSEFELELGAQVDADGIYTVTFDPETSTVPVQDTAGNKVAGSTFVTWRKGDDFVAPTVGIQSVAPVNMGELPFAINFSEDVVNVDAVDDTDPLNIFYTNLVLFFDDGPDPIKIPVGSLTGPVGPGGPTAPAGPDSFYTLDLGVIVAANGAGEYSLTVLDEIGGGTIVDSPGGNALVRGTTETFRIGDDVLNATIESLRLPTSSSVLITDVGEVTITFKDATDASIAVDPTKVSILDFRLTRNGQNIPLTDLVVEPVSGTNDSTYKIDLSTVTDIPGDYTLTLVAEGSGISAGPIPLLNDVSVSWVNGSIISVTELLDAPDDLAGDGIVGDGTEETQTLRAAIQEANALAGSNIIELAAGKYELSIGGIDEDLAATGDLDIRDNLTIRGTGVAVFADDGITLLSGTAIDGGALDRIFQVFAGVTLNLENLTITNGALTGSADGAGIRNSGTTTLTNVEVTGNVAADSAGGLNNTGLMIIVDSTISGNSAGGSGGGIRNTGTLEVTRSTISGNSTARDGGAIFNAGAGNVTLSNSTFSGNHSDRSGGAIRNTATMTATNNTFTLNDAGTNGGAISNTDTSTLQNNLVIGNTAATNAELNGDFISLGGNLTGLLGSATGIGALDIVDVIDPTPVLDLTLADNGGPTLTHALLQGSIAIDAGGSIGVDELEQRGSTRVLGSSVDIGAVEFGVFFVNSLLDTVDVTPGDGIAADADGNITLRAAIMEANALAGDSVIILGPGMYDLTILNDINSDLDDASTGDLDVTDLTGSLTITGAGNGQTIINATALNATALDDRVFDVLVGIELTLDGVTITGGHAVGGSGGGIRNLGTLSLLNTVVDANTADINGGGILNGQLNQQGTLNLLNSTVSNNNAVDGGGIFNNDQSTMTLADSDVTGNTAAGDGGGIFNDLEATIDLTRSSVSGNTSTLDGGGIYNNDLAILTISDSKVNSNTADQGAGIFNEEAAALTISRTTVSGNNALLSGGGIYNDEGVVLLSDVSILTNMAASDGGGFYNASAGEVMITDSLFKDNSADRDGGAIANFGVSLSLTGTIIRDSEALRNGGGLFNDQEEGAVNLTSTSLINNEAVAGGGIYNQELGTINLDLSAVNDNSASTNGGGIYNKDDGTINLQRTTVDGNTAADDGAGIFNEHNAQLNILSSTLSNNIASRFGGGIYNNSIALADIVNATISGNDAVAGGGIYNDEEGSMEITNATIFNNSATTGGGILNAVDGFVSVANSIIAGNTDSSASPDVRGGFDSRGNNLIGIEDGSTGFDVGIPEDMVGTVADPINAGLGALQDNGGATFTHELIGGSLARDAGNNFYAPTDDQRGFARLFDGDGNGSLIVDIGAFESGYIVSSFGDSVDANPGDGVSVDANGQSTLRAAIMEANTRIGADTILLGTGVYTLSLFGQYEENALLGDLDITDDLTIIGAGSGRTFIDADFLDRIFHIFTNINVSIRGVTLVNGSVTRVEDGGAILNFGNLTLEDVTIENSLANRGGALFNNGFVTMTDSFFRNNTAIADGGAIFNNDSGTITIDMSTISGNDAENGGGIFNSTGGTLGVNDTTIDGNTATVAGGGVFISNEVAVGNGEGGSGVIVPAASSEVVVAETFELHTSPKYDIAEAGILSEAPPFPVSDTFNLSSLPGSNFTIYLDFDGHTTTGTQWNTFFNQVSIVTPAYDTDGDVGTFSMSEIEDIQRAWLRVSEDFAPFNINVTTAEPPLSDLIRSDASDTRWGVRAVSGVDTFDLTGTGGLAFLTSFNASTDTPAFVFNAGLIGVAETISHEVGHTLGLNHDGTSAVEYYPGHGSGPTAWATIMGAGFLQQGLVQWSQGEYTDADNSEDDLSIITSQNGFSYRADDHGNGLGFASIITGGTASGIVERNSDVDYFQITTTGGDVSIDPFFESPNLDILATLYDSSGTQIQTSNPTGALNASFIGLAAGTYFVSIEGTGEGDVLGTGYSDYASLGQYTITFNAEPPMVTPGDVTISNSTISYNIAGTRGGGLLNEDTIEISNVTFSGNESGKEGGAIHNTGELRINNSTIYDNTTEGSGGGIYSVSASASVTASNTIIAGNHALVSGYDLEGVFTSAGNNLIGTPDTATGFIDGFNNDIVGSNAQRVDPVLSILKDNGGPTFTHALLAGSLAIDAGDNTDGVVNDQRGATRPTDTTSDIGAYEFVTPTISISDISQVETNIGTTVFEILVSLSNVNVDEVTVDYETSNGTAEAGIDYQFTSGTVTFSPGETTQTIEVIVNGDITPEAYETFFVNLFNSVGATIDKDQSLGTIKNDDAEISIDPVSLDEGPVGTTTDFNFIVSLSHPVAGVVTVDYITADGTAMSGIDYVGISNGKITFFPDEDLEKTVTVVVNGDSEIEPEEKFNVELSTATATNTVGDVDFLSSIGTGTIKNDDFALLSISDVTRTENYDDGDGDPTTITFKFTVSLSQALIGDTITVLASTMNGTAESGSSSPYDYEAKSETVMFAPGVTERPFEVTVFTDSGFFEDNEFFYVNLSNPTNSNIVDGQGVGTIVENGIVVTTLDDIVDSGDGLISLREAITQANDNVGVVDNIILLDGEYIMTRDGVGENLNDTGDFDILESVNIFGQGTGLTRINADPLNPFNPADPFDFIAQDGGNGIDRIFHTGIGVALNLSNMELRNGNADDGGALFTQGPTTLNQLIFLNNNADFWGGAILSTADIDITDAQFLNNHAGFQGGALYQYQETATISHSTFDGNTSDARAGAVYVASGATFNVSESLFNNNVAGSRGGAIYTSGTTNSTNVTFSENHSGSRGGAIFTDGELDVLNNTLTMNTADQSGGGIYNEGEIKSLKDTTFSANHAGVDGGAIYNDGTLDMVDNILSLNTAVQSGGGIYNKGDTVSTGTTFSENSAGVHGGAIFNDSVSVDGTLDFENTTLYLNTAVQSGGGVYNKGLAEFTNTTFSANHAGVRGGAIFNDGILELLYNTLTLNTADQWGGGISNSNTNTVTLYNTIVAGNIAVIGNDDLDGDYSPILGPPVVASQYNLIGNIGTATGLTNGVNSNIVGSSLSPIDAMLDVLADNDGNTLTHNLMPGSPAIDAGLFDDGNLLDPYPTVDQRGQARPVNGSGLVDPLADIGAVEFRPGSPPPLFGTKGDVELAVEHTRIQLSVVTDQTAVSSDGHTSALPADAEWIHEWESFWVEVWVNTASGLSISDVLTEIAYNSDYFTATSVEYGSSFAVNTTAVIDDAAGVVRNLSGSTEQSDVGGTGHALFARIRFESLAGDQVEVDPSDLTLDPLELGLEVLNTKVDIADVGEVIANVGALPETELYPVIYDINDDDAVNFRDLIVFASVYSQDVYNASSQFVAAMDFNKSGRVDFRDLTQLAANYGKSKSGNTAINFPTTFGQKWIGTSLEVASGDDSIGQVIEAAVDTWETALGLEEPLEVEVIVRDFGTAQLGSGQTTEYSVDGIPVAGRVVIDDDANGLGWHVDVADLPAGTGYDLYTVLLHEIGHVLGFTRYYSGFGNLIETDGNGDLTFVGSDFTVDLDAAGYHIDDPDYSDDLMSDTLDPGVRKTPSALNVQMFLEAYQNVGATGGGGTSSPIFGTNSVPAENVEPVLVKSIEAAKVFVDQSTVGFVAPAAIKNTEEDSSLDQLRQVASFDAIQPSLFDQGTPFERSEVDETIFEDLYSTEFENSLTGSGSDDRELVFAHSENEQADDFSENLESMDEAFSNWEGPLL